MIQFPLCLLVSPRPYVSTLIPDPFVLPLSSWPAYISLICHVCLLSSYINFNLTSTVILHLRMTWVFHLAVFPTSGNCLTLIPLLFDFLLNQKPSRHTHRLYNFPATCETCIYLHTITYPEMEHLAKLLHHAMKTALFPLFFYQVVTKILQLFA